MGPALRKECPSKAFREVTVFQSQGDHEDPGERWSSEDTCVQGRAKLFKGKCLGCTGSSGLFSGETQETTCRNRSLLLRLRSFKSLGSPEGLNTEEGVTERRSALHKQSVGNVQREGRGFGHVGKE